MSVRRTCDVCHFSRQKADGSDDVVRYGLSRVFSRPDVPPERRRELRTMRGFGGIDLCTECWERIAKPKQRPNNGPRKRYAASAAPDGLRHSS